MFIRTGSFIASGERVVCGLAQQFGSLCFVDDNAGCFGNEPMPANGSIICFGEHQVYVATEIPRVYPEKVHVAGDSPAFCAVRGRRIDRLANCVEVMMTAPAAGTGADKEVDAAAAGKTTRPAKLPLERSGAFAGEAGDRKSVV